MKKTNLKALTECSIMVALSAVLSIVPLFEMPYGGSITLASMLPVVMIAYRYGMREGLMTACAASLIQMLLGMKNFSYFTSWQSIVALAIFDYVLAFCVFGLSGIFKKQGRAQGVALVSGAALASVLRYVCHVISGATIWAGLSIPTEAALAYSLSYNATYMLPETVILIISAVYLGRTIDLCAKTPTRMKTEGFDARESKTPTRMKSEKFDARESVCLAVSGLVLLAALITDTVLVFSKLQNQETGEFTITALATVNWLAVAIVTAVAVIVALLLFLLAKMKKKTA